MVFLHRKGAAEAAPFDAPNDLAFARPWDGGILHTFFRGERVKNAGAVKQRFTVPVFWCKITVAAGRAWQESRGA